MANVLVLGSGGREHALAWKLGQSEEVERVFVAPGNGGTAVEFENVSLGNDFQSIVDFVMEKQVDLVVVGPEKPLSEGVVDYLESKGVSVFGPGKEAARIEADKIFAKELMKEKGVNTADFKVVKKGELLEEAGKWLEEKGGVVVKYPFLAAGKGVYVCRDKEELSKAYEDIFVRQKFGAVEEVLVEDLLEGEEASFIVLTDGERILPLLPSQDHKQIFEGDKGPNTGGMGAYAPTSLVSEELGREIVESIIRPTLEGLKERGIEYKGALYAGLMITEEGPFVLEFNCRFGDPETQPLMMLLDSDFYRMTKQIARKEKITEEVKWKEAYAVNVVLASKGYPGAYEKGKLIKGVKKAEADGVKVFHAGTKYENKEYYTNGGRVLGVTAVDETIEKAVKKAYEAIERINFEGMYYRKDIASKEIKRGQ